MITRFYTLIMVAALSGVLASCGSQPVSEPTDTIAKSESVDSGTPTDPLDNLLQQARQAFGDKADALRLEAIKLMIERGDWSLAATTLSDVNTPRKRSALAFDYWLLQSQIDVHANDLKSAERALSRIDASVLTSAQQLSLLDQQAFVASMRHKFADVAQFRISQLQLSRGREQEQNAARAVLVAFGQIPFRSLKTRTRPDTEWDMWRTLSVALRDLRLSPSAQQQAIADWRSIYAQSTHFEDANDLASEYLRQLRSPERIAVLLPLSSRSTASAEAVLNGILAEYFESAQRGEPAAELRVFDTGRIENLGQLADRILAFAPDLIIGPLLKENLDDLVTNLFPGIPLLALNFSDLPSAGEQTIQFGLDPMDEVRQLVRLASVHPRAILVSSNSPTAIAARDELARQWTTNQGEIIDSLTYQDINEYRRSLENSLNISQSEERRRELSGITGIRLQSQVRRRQDVDQFIVLAEPEAARTIKPLLEYAWAGDIPVIASSLVHAARNQNTFDRDLEGVSFVDLAIFSEGEQTLLGALRADGSLASPADRLAALGADAFRLQYRLGALQWMPLLGMAGATGELSLDDQHRIHRQSHWYRFKDGDLIPMQDAPGS